jgi:hypothetical protein
MSANKIRNALLLAIVVGFSARAGGPPSIDVPELPMPKQFGDDIDLGIGLAKWLGKTGKTVGPRDNFGIACNGCVKDAHPNAVVITPDRPCSPRPCPNAREEEIAFEQGIAMMRARFKAHQEGKELEVALPKEATSAKKY